VTETVGKLPYDIKWRDEKWVISANDCDQIYCKDEKIAFRTVKAAALLLRREHEEKEAEKHFLDESPGGTAGWTGV